MASDLLSVLKGITDEKKKYGVDDDTILYEDEHVETLSTGSIIIDKLLGRENNIGGVGKGRITEAYGLESCGKTTLALHIAKKCQDAGGNVCFADFEAALDRIYAKNLGVNLDPSRFAHLRPMSLEEGVNIIDVLLDNYAKSKIDVLIVDSVKAMTPKQVLEGLATDEPPMAVQARKIGNFLSKLTKKIKDTKTVVILLNQMTKNIKMNPYQGGGEYETPGGLAVRFYASTRIQLQKVTTELVKAIDPITNKEEDLPDTNIVRASIIKNKIGTPYRKGLFAIKFGKGVDNKRSIIDMAIAHGIVLKTGGAWFTYKENQGGFKIQGEDKVRELLSADENKGLLGEIVERLTFAQAPEVKEEAVQQEELDKKADRIYRKKIKKEAEKEAETKE